MAYGGYIYNKYRASRYKKKYKSYKKRYKTYTQKASASLSKVTLGKYVMWSMAGAIFLFSFMLGFLGISKSGSDATKTTGWTA